jgi:hypothetical protein
MLDNEGYKHSVRIRNAYCFTTEEKFILVINQLDAQKFCFTISLFHAATCFERHVLIIRRPKLYYTVSGIITPMGVFVLQ